MSWVPEGVMHVPDAYAPPFHRALGIQVGLGPAREGVAWVELDPEVHFGARWAHGGLVGVLADVASGIVVAQAFTEPMGVIEGTVEMKVNFLRRVTEGDLTATARLLRLGKRMAFTEVDLTSTGTLVARALATFMLADDAVRRDGS